MKQKILISLFVITLFVVGLLNMFFPSAATISELENRTLETIPAITKENFFSGEFFSRVESYYSDHFFKRETFVMFNQSVNDYKGIKGKDSVELITTVRRDEFVDNSGESMSSEEVIEEIPEEVLIELTQEKKSRITTANDLNQRVRNLAKAELEFFTELKPIQLEVIDNDSAIEQLEITDNEDLSGGMSNGFLVVNDSCYELFGYSEASCTFYADGINSFAEQLPEGDKVYSIVAPSHIEFISSEKYRSMAESQADAINYINGEFSEKVTPINIYNALASHSDDYIYFRSDHHWTARGAYYAYTSFAKTIGDKPYELEAFEKDEVEGFLGTLYNRTLSKAVKANPDTVEIFKPFVENTFNIHTKGGSVIEYDVINMYWENSSNKYMVFLSGDNPLSIIDTNLDNGKKIMVFKDSYGNAFVPFLMNHYDEIYIIDPRHYENGALTLAKENDIHEFLFLNYSKVIAGNTGFAKNIYKVSY